MRGTDDIPSTPQTPSTPSSSTLISSLKDIKGLDVRVVENPDSTIAKRAHYAPPWADVSIIGIAGSSGSGKSTLSQAIVKKLNLPWVVILSIDSFYKSLDEEASRKAFRNEYDFDSPEVRRLSPLE